MSAAPDPSRRALLFGRAAAVPSLRPPWALDESAFLEACTSCGACVERCAERLLVRVDTCLPRRGVVCSSCRDACPERAIAFPLTSRIPVPVVDADRCSGCGACVAICPAGATSLQSTPREIA
jgi:ferredoxin-type protein NapF